MIKFREFIQKTKAFINENPRRRDFILTLLILALIPITVITALAVQNLTQHAGGGSVVTISGQDGLPLTTTSNPNVFININLNASTNWVLPNQPSAFNLKDNLVNKAYAIDTPAGGGVPCIQKGDANGDGEINMGDVTKVERIIQGLDPTTSGADANSDGKIDMGDVTKIERIILGLDKTSCVVSPTPTSAPISPTPVPTSSLTPTMTSVPVITPTPMPNILRAIHIENIDTDESTGGSDPITITVNSITDINHIAWKLNKLSLGQTQAPRIVQVTFLGDAAPVSFVATVNLTKPDGSTQTLSSVDLSLFDCSQQLQVGQECHMSAMANDTVNGPISKGVTYAWGISSINSIGTFNQTNGNIAGFFAQNIGTGDIWVIAQQGNIQVQKSINMQVVANTVNKLTAPVSVKTTVAMSPTITPTIHFDLNKDGVINDKDLNILVSQYGKSGSNLPADLNRDGKVNGYDYNILLRCYAPNPDRNATPCPL